MGTKHTWGLRLRRTHSTFAWSHLFLQNPLHIANLAVGGVGLSASARPLCRCQTGSTIPGVVAELPTDPTSGPSNRAVPPRGHGLNRCRPHHLPWSLRTNKRENRIEKTPHSGSTSKHSRKHFIDNVNYKQTLQVLNSYTTKGQNGPLQTENLSQVST